MKKILSSLRLANSFLPSQLTRTNSLLTQVTHSPLNTFHYTNQFMLFSSQPNQIINLVLTDDWSQQLEQKIYKSNIKMTHESVVYILKNLDKDPLKASKFLIWVTEKNGFDPNSSSFCLLLRILAKNVAMTEFWFTVNKMKEYCLFIDEESYKTMVVHFKSLKMVADASALTRFYNTMVQSSVLDCKVKEVVDVVWRLDWDCEVEKRLMEMGICVSEVFVVRVLMGLRKRPLKAFEVFKWFVKGCGFQHRIGTYNVMVRVLGRYDSIEEFWSLLKEMKDVGYDLDIDTYIKISRRFQKNKMIEDAVNLYEYMMDGPYKPLAKECSLLLRAIAASSTPDLDLVFRVVDKFEVAGHILEKTGYDLIHRSLTRVGRFDEAEKIMETMRNTGYEPDNITYSQLIHGLCKARRLEDACKVLDVMIGNECLPDLKTWTTLIQGHCAAGEVDRALFYFSRMMEENCEADADLLDVLVNGFLNQKRIDGAYTLLIELVNRARLRPWQATYRNLIQDLLGERKLEEAVSLLHLMRKSNYPPYPEPFLQYISKFGTVDDTLRFLKALSSKEYPTISAYQHVFQCLFQEGRHSEARDLLYKCPLHIRKHEAICSLFGSVESTSSGAA
ncbi:Pentatricopeptide repeat-containing protein [Heracleum sosnowskyi]|uniref:Pentatricopeptide repeat-containing protein n=1 Tax=Heracleum sosnowskyi TaxID=360622 RepID=A0AAD8HUV4_9APIA|nr:Pentatricopeptide repeat-containing protein [Heracleum sosnowskyi]